MFFVVGISSGIQMGAVTDCDEGQSILAPR
jgi:hypothetical protein